MAATRGKSVKYEARRPLIAADATHRYDWMAWIARAVQMTLGTLSAALKNKDNNNEQ